MSQPDLDGRVLRSNKDAPLKVELAEDALGNEWSGLGFWFRWVLITTLGWLIGGVVAGLAVGLSGRVDSVAYYATAYVCSVITVLLQWLVLRPRMVRAWRWIVVSMAGIAIGLALLLGIQAALRASLGYGSVAESLLAPFLEALPAVLAQWLLLRTVARRAWGWIVVSFFWLVPIALYTLANSSPEPPEIESGIEIATFLAVELGVRSALWGVFASSISGIEMAWLMRHPKTQNAIITSDGSAD